MILKLVKSKLHSQIAKNGMWMILMHGFNTIVPLLTLPYITRILSTSAYGNFSIALNWVGYFQIVVEYGLGFSGARRAATIGSKDELEKIRASIICARLILLLFCAVLFAFLIAVANLVHNQITCMAILFFMVVATVFQQNWYFQGIAEMKNIAIINVISRTISVVLVFLFVKKPEDIYLYCFLYVSNYLISSLCGFIIVRLKYGIKLQIPTICAIKNELIEGWPLFASTAMAKIFGSIGITILGFFSTAEEVGIYSAINKVPYVLMVLYGAVSHAIYPFSCKSFENSFDNGLKKIRKYAVPVWLFFAFGGILTMSLNRIIVTVAFGEDYTSGSKLLIPFVLWVLLSIVNNFLGVQTLVASGHQKEYSFSFFVSSIALMTLMLVLGHFFFAYGIAYASVFSELVLSFTLLFFVKRIQIRGG